MKPKLSRKMGWLQILKHIREDRPLTTFEASRICGVSHGAISKWIDQGKLNAYKTPGGHRRIRMMDFLIFLKVYDIPLPPDAAQAAEEIGKE